MPTVHANGIDIYYEVQGKGEPIVLIPYLAADQQCYAFQVQDYAKHVLTSPGCRSAPRRECGLRPSTRPG